ncbi:TIGR03986 family type III CRISPR-associated RAMP protein [Desulfonema ishimotonii]|nr:TIGR03986 family CRISPR-associated RAMP protein [Desulfonema ishimotonii]
MFRLAYEKTIGEHVPENLRFMRYEITPDDIEQLRDADVPSEIIEKLEGLEKKIFFKNEFHEKLDNILKGRDQEYRSLILKHAGKYDIAQAIFGNTEAFSGRVFFEDAFMSAEQNPKDVLLDTNIPQILGTPKPTTFQHYLVQESDDLKNLSHYNDNTSIRGNKMYWHQPGKDWVERRDDMRSKKNITTKITPVKEGNRFQGRIRFENLSEVELGALLFALELPEGCFHKLGMGKPIGLGSVEIRPKLHISDRRKRYENLFYEWEKENSETDDTSKYKKEFEQYVLQQIGESNGELWKTDRLYELKIMLNFRLVQSAENRNKVRYMQIEGKNKNEYKERPVLPKPSRIRN